MLRTLLADRIAVALVSAALGHPLSRAQLRLMRSPTARPYRARLQALDAALECSERQFARLRSAGVGSTGHP
jgi:hypothetical protein